MRGSWAGVHGAGQGAIAAPRTHPRPAHPWQVPECMPAQRAVGGLVRGHGPEEAVEAERMPAHRIHGGFVEQVEANGAGKVRLVHDEWRWTDRCLSRQGMEGCNGENGECIQCKGLACDEADIQVVKRASESPRSLGMTTTLSETPQPAQFPILSRHHRPSFPSPCTGLRAETPA